MSIRRFVARKKSEPKIGRLTSANKKECVTLSPGSERKMFLRPYVCMEEPLAAVKLDKALVFFWAADAGKTETSAPLSTRKARRRRRQNTERAPSEEEEEEERTW